MKRASVSSVLITMALLASSAVAHEHEAITAKSVNLRAGPTRDYPLVVILPPQYPIHVFGCVSGYIWCDVMAGPNRGWVYAANIEYQYQNSYTPILGYGAVLGIGVIGFIIGDYWNDHYRSRPFYAQRQEWIHRPPMPGYHPHAVAPRNPYKHQRPPKQEHHRIMPGYQQSPQEHRHEQRSTPRGSALHGNERNDSHQGHQDRNQNVR